MSMHDLTEDRSDLAWLSELTAPISNQFGASLSEPHLVRTTPVLSIYSYVRHSVNALRPNLCKGKKFGT